MYSDGQIEGFAYLGAGCIFALFISLLFFIGNTEMKCLLKEHWQKIAALFIVTLCTVIVTLLPVITLNDICLKEFELPNLIYRLWSIFRASGRIVWIIIYVVVLCSIAMIAKLFNRRTAVILLTGCLTLQIYDIHTVLENKNIEYNRVITYDSTLKNTEFWDNIAQNNEIKHIVFTDMFLDQTIEYAFADWATKNGKTLNTFYFARSISDRISQNLNLALEQLSSENLYIFFDRNMLNCLKYPLYYYRIDEYIIGYVNPIKGYDELDLHNLTIQWRFGDDNFLQDGSDTENGRLLYAGGLSYGPYWSVPDGRWIIIINGERLADTDIGIYSQYDQQNHEFEFETVSDYQIVISLLLSTPTNTLEICIRNATEHNILIKQMSIGYDERYDEPKI